MGCGNCGTAGNGKPAGCQSNGGCSSGGCNKMNVFDWLADLPLPDGLLSYDVVEVSFNQGGRKEFFRNAERLDLYKGQLIAVEGINGFDVGQVSLQGELVKLQMKKYAVRDNEELLPILRTATDEDVDTMHTQKGREQELLVASRALARNLNLPMKIAQVEMQADGKRGIFYYTADQRVDFRELIRTYATEFRLRVEMRQIGARQESGKVGGIGSCGRELCCSTWLTDFKSVTTSAARYQNLAINQTKLSGQCGRLKCCLNYELDTYMDALRQFPAGCDHLETEQGIAHLQKRDIFRSLMWYSYRGSNKQYPVTIERAKEVANLNKEGTKPDDLGALDVESVVKPKDGAKPDMSFVNDVGQVSLRALERNHKKQKSKSRQQPQAPRGEGSEKQQQQPGPRPQASGPRPRRAAPPEGSDAEKKPQQERRPRPQQGQPGGGRQRGPRGEKKERPGGEGNAPA